MVLPSQLLSEAVGLVGLCVWKFINTTFQTKDPNKITKKTNCRIITKSNIMVIFFAWKIWKSGLPDTGYSNVCKLGFRYIIFDIWTNLS